MLGRKEPLGATFELFQGRYLDIGKKERKPSGATDND